MFHLPRLVLTTLLPIVVLGQTQIDLQQSKFMAPGDGAVNRSGSSKLSDISSVKDFGAVGDGVTDDSPAIQKALVATAGKGQRLFFPAGTYMLSSPLVLPDTTSIFGVGAGDPGSSNTVLKALPTFSGSVVVQMGASTPGSSIQVEKMTIDGSLVAGSCLMDLYAQELSYGKDLKLSNCATAALVISGSGAQNAGPFENVAVSLGTGQSVTTSSLCVKVTGVTAFRGIRGLTCSAGPTYGSRPATAMLLDGGGNYSDIHVEHFATAITLGSASTAADGVVVSNAQFGPDVDTGIAITGSNNNENLSFMGISCAGCSSLLSDAQMATNITDPSIGWYMIGSGTGDNKAITSGNSAVGTKFTPLFSDPSSASDGSMWYRADTHQLNLRSGSTTMHILTSGSSGPFLASGLTGATPSLPAAGNTEIYFPTTGGPQALDAIGNTYAMPPSTILNAPANGFWAGPASGSNAAPVYRPLVSADLPSTAMQTATANNITASGSSSQSTLRLSGTWATSGYPALLIMPSGSTSSWNANGTGLGVAAPSGWSGLLLDLQQGTSKFSVDYQGNATAAGSITGSGLFSMSQIQAGTSNSFNWPNKSRMLSPSDGIIEFAKSTSGFNVLQFGGTTAAYPALNINGTSIEAKLADGSAYSSFGALLYNCQTGVTPATPSSGYSLLFCPATGGPSGLDANGSFYTMVEPIPSISHQWINGISPTGAVTQSQPAFNDLTGTASLSQVPVAATTAPSAYTVSTLPTSPVANQIVQISDGTSIGDCTIGRGTVKHWCQWSGSAWVFLERGNSILLGSPVGPDTSVSGTVTYGGIGSWGTTPFSTTETNRYVAISRACRIGNFTMTIRPTDIQPATGTLVISLRKNGADVPISVTVPAGATGGVYSDVNDTADYAAGDVIDIKVINNAGAQSATLQSLMMTCSY